MKVTSLKEFAEKKKQKAFDEEMKRSDFAFDMWNNAVKHERYLPWPMAIKLIHQIMIDHGIKVQDIEAHSEFGTE